MLRIARQISLIAVFIFLMGAFYVAKAETLKRYSTVCRTKDQFREIIDNRDNKAYVMQMLIDGKCVMNVTEPMSVTVLQGIFPLVKVKLKWGNETFIGWTDAIFIQH